MLRLHYKLTHFCLKKEKLGVRRRPLKQTPRLPKKEKHRFPMVSEKGKHRLPMVSDKQKPRYLKKENFGVRKRENSVSDGF